MTILWINVLLAIPFIALWTGIPLWLVLRRPDVGPSAGAAPAGPAVMTLPAVRQEDDRYQPAA